jgi:hypothetical protein
MFALPPDLAPGTGDRVTGITCPTCHGSLEVRAEGAGHLHFTCRVGHSFSLREVLTSLERFLEDTVWNVIRGTEELVALLEDVVAYRDRIPGVTSEGAYEQRLRRANAQAAALRALVERDEPITFNDGGPAAERAEDGP